MLDIKCREDENVKLFPFVVFFHPPTTTESPSSTHFSVDNFRFRTSTNRIPTFSETKQKKVYHEERNLLQTTQKVF